MHYSWARLGQNATSAAEDICANRRRPDRAWSCSSLVPPAQQSSSSTQAKSRSWPSRTAADTTPLVDTPDNVRRGLTAILDVIGGR